MQTLDPAMEAIVRIGTPLLFAALGELILERSGIINIGIEGVMLMGAFCGYCGACFGASPVLGAMAGALGGMLLMLLFAWLVLHFRADQIVTGMALNLLAMGVTGTFYMALGNAGLNSRAPTFQPVWAGAGNFILLGPLLFMQTALTWIALFLVPVIWFYLVKTERGLELRAVGEHPRAAEASGVSVLLCRWKACCAAGVLGGLGGAFLTLSQTASFAPRCTNGRGFVALAAVVLGRYGSFGTAGACLFFGAAFYARDAFPGKNVPSDLVEMLPYVLTIVALCFKVHARSAPAALGK